MSAAAKRTNKRVTWRGQEHERDGGGAVHAGQVGHVAVALLLVVTAAADLAVSGAGPLVLRAPDAAQLLLEPPTALQLQQLLPDLRPDQAQLLETVLPRARIENEAVWL